MSSAQAASSLAADAPRYNNDQLVGAYYARNTGSGVAVVQQLVAGAGITLNPAGGQGVVTVTSTAVGVSAINPGNNTGATTLASSDSSVVITSPSAGNINFSVPSAISTSYTLAATAVPDSGSATVATLTNLVVGQVYLFSTKFVMSVIPSATVLGPHVYINIFLTNTRNPGSSAPIGGSTTVAFIPVQPLVTLMAVPGGSALLQQWNITGYFEAQATSSVFTLNVSSYDLSQTSGLISTPGISFAGSGSNSISVTPVEFRTS